MMLKVKRFTVLEGPFYEVHGGECGPLHVFDSEVVAVVEDGRIFGNNHIVSGHGGYSEDGFAVPNWRYKDECLAIIAQLKAVSEIDDAVWCHLPQDNTTLEERFAHEAIREEQERQGVPVEPPTPIPPVEAPYCLRPDDLRALALEERMLMGGGLSDADRAFLSRYNE